MIQLEAQSLLSLIDKYIHTKQSNFTACTVDDKTLVDGVSISKRNLIHIQQKKKRNRRRERRLKRSTSIIDDGNDETYIRHARLYPLSIHYNNSSLSSDDEKDHSSK
jgi:hypothetical protein